MADPRRDPYDVLGVPRDADARSIRDAYRRLARQWHPDRNPDPGAEDRFKEISDAYAVLGDPRQRAAWDARSRPRPRRPGAEDFFNGFEELMRRATAYAGAGPFVERFHRGPRGPVRGQDVVLDLKVTLERVLHGGTITLDVDHDRPCPACAGSGARAGTSPRVCPTCGGTGEQVVVHTQGEVAVRHVGRCSECDGRREVVDDPCPDCHGAGHVRRTEPLTLHLPRGVEDGIVLRAQGHGEPSPDPGGPAGDLLLRVHVQPDPRFERHGADLWREEAIEVEDAVLGARLEVPGLDGPVVVEVAPGTAPGDEVEVPGEGLPVYGRAQRGSLRVRLRMRVPRQPSDQERKLYEALRRLRRGSGTDD